MLIEYARINAKTDKHLTNQSWVSGDTKRGNIHISSGFSLLPAARGAT
jgi:hypothetical protein